jgi:hypothetical protein
MFNGLVFKRIPKQSIASQRFRFAAFFAADLTELFVVLSHLAWKIPQGRRDFHFSHRRCDDYDE